MLEAFLKKLPDKHKGKTSDFRGLFRTRSNIYNGDFFAKIVNFNHLISYIFYWVLNMPLDFMTIYFFETSKNICLFSNVTETLTAAKFRDTATILKILYPTKVLKFDATINLLPRSSCFLT